MKLHEFFQRYPRAALAFSGGVDSAYLLYAAHQAGAQVQPYFIRTAFQPAFEQADAQRLCRQFGILLRTIEIDILSDAEITENSHRRCYYCKRRMFQALKQVALADGYGLLLDGTNASDDANDRPGMQALLELQVRSPLRECGLHKDEIRALSKDAGLFTWDKPAYACLATRIRTGTVITANDLSRIERAEDLVRKLGFSDFRVRLRDNSALLQLQAAQMPQALVLRQKILTALQPDFTHIMLDLEARL